MKQPRRGHYWLERPDPTEHFASVVSRHPHGGELADPFVDVQVGRIDHFETAIGQVYGPLSIVRKAREELLADSNDLVDLSTSARYFSRKQDVLGVVKHPPKSMAGEGSAGGPMPGHNHPAVQSSGERHPDAFATTEVPREVSREGLSDFLVEGLRVQGRLVLPFARPEVKVFSLD